MPEGKERKTLFSPLTGRKSEVFFGENSRYIGSGNEARYVTRELILVKNGRERTVGEFAERDTKYARAWEFYVPDEYIKHYLQLKKADLPVPLTIRQVEGSNKIIITDLTEGGKKCVFSTNDIHNKTIDFEAIVKNKQSVKTQLIEISQKADRAGFNIYEDTYFFILDANGNTKVILGDLGVGVTKKTNNFFDYHASEREARRLFNKLAHKGMVESIKKIVIPKKIAHSD
ncbi:MAG: hypothetical protein KBC00_01435 [Candidatus Levybacteria bacterium]|nr:hypothetical protein [Candidatus Levybacteria bacterium]MBP9814790.1 hypothetical protein [Candidatus Levybacteria bacterium]